MSSIASVTLILYYISMPYSIDTSRDVVAISTDVRMIELCKQAMPGWADRIKAMGSEIKDREKGNIDQEEYNHILDYYTIDLYSCMVVSRDGKVFSVSYFNPYDPYGFVEEESQWYDSKTGKYLGWHIGNPLNTDLSKPSQEERVASYVPAHFIRECTLAIDEIGAYLHSRYPKVKTVEKINRMPPEVKFTSELENKIEYDAKNKLLIFRGAMTKREHDILKQLSQEPSYNYAVDRLYINSKDMRANEKLSDIYNYNIIIIQNDSEYDLLLMIKTMNQPFNSRHNMHFKLSKKGCTIIKARNVYIPQIDKN